VVKNYWVSLLGSEQLFPGNLIRAQVQRDLRQMPQPVNCPLTFTNATTWQENAEKLLKSAKTMLDSALQDKARLLLSPLLKSRLNEGKQDERIHQILMSPSEIDLVNLFLKFQNNDDFADWLQKLGTLLRSVQIVKIKVSDFKAQNKTYRANEIDQLSAEFKQYLLDQFSKANADDVIIELE
jgi:hypothetical protein